MPFSRVLARLRYRFDRLIADGARGKLVVLLLLCAGLLLLGAAAGLLGLFAEANKDVPGVTRDLDAGPLDALWWSFHHLLDPSFFAESYGATWPVIAISLLTALGGMTVFGLLVGFISSEVEARLEALRHGDGPVVERGHALVLGWSDRAPAVIGMLAERGTVAVLAPREAATMREELQSCLGPTAMRRVVLRSGRPDRREDLHRVALADARCCIVLPENGDDAAAARTLLMCLRQPRIAAEAADAANAPLLALAGSGRAPIVAAAQVVSSLLLQASRQRGVIKVHMHLLDPELPGFRFVHRPALAGLAFGDAAFAFPGAVLCGISAAERLPSGGERYLVSLNPPPHRVIGHDDWLVVLAAPGEIADRGADLAWQASAQRARQAVTSLPPSGEGWNNSVFVAAHALPGLAPTERRHQVLILGWNEAVIDLLAGYDACRGPTAVVVVASRLGNDEAQTRLERRRVSLRRIRPRFVECDLAASGVIPGLQPEAYDCVLLLHDAEAGGDSASALNLIRLGSHLRRHGPNTRVVVELADGGAAESLQALGAEVVVGAEAVGRQLVAVAEQNTLAAVFEELHNSTGCEIYLKPLSRYLPDGAGGSFADLTLAAQRRRETALGLRRADGRIELAPAKDAAVRADAGDQAIVLADDLYDATSG